MFSDLSVCVSPGGQCVFVVFVDFGCPGDNFGGNFGVLEHPEARKGHTMDPKMPPGQDLENFWTCRRRIPHPFWSTFSTCWCFFRYFFAVLKK